MKYLPKLLISSLLLFAILFSPNFASAQEDIRTNTLNEIVDALNRETEEVFNDYIAIIDEFENGDESTFLKFTNKLPIWKSVLSETKNVFVKYKFSSDSEISEISNLAVEANNESLIGISLYEKAINSDSDTEFDNYIENADKSFIEGSETHFKAVDLYNDYSGSSSSISSRNWLIFFSVLSGLFSFLFFIKSRKKSQLESEKIRAEVYKGLLLSSIWMTVGMIITTVGFSYALKEGGTYYILYGPILFGGWKLLKGLYYYFTEGRKALNYLNLAQENEAIKQSYSIPERESKTSEFVCPYCGFKNSNKSVICKNCGENIL